jgi:2-dehydro-3-deoxyphosphogluconate aldolase/(4S)-4-hydroxy-2-oxoglutarate aldolase
VKIAELLRLSPVIPVLVLDDVALAVPLARVLVRSGLKLLEITLRTAAALECIVRIAAEVPDAMVGAGTVLTGKDLKRVTKAGAKFVVTPGFSARLSNDAEIPLLPGVATAGEIMQALHHGHDHMMLFPAEIAGGVAALKALHGPFPGVRFCPSGGLTYDTAPVYLAQPNVACIGASWIAPPKALAEQNWDHIEFLAHEAASLARHQD